MRRISAYILIFILFILTITGCSKQDSISNAQIPTKFESNFNANCGKLEISGHISKFETGVYTISITAPESLEGMKFSCVGSKISTNLGDINFETHSENLSSASFIKSVTNALDASANATVTKTDGYTKYQADDLCLLQEQETGHIVSLVIESADISMNFVEFKTY